MLYNLRAEIQCIFNSWAEAMDEKRATIAQTNFRCSERLRELLCCHYSEYVSLETCFS